MTVSEQLSPRLQQFQAEVDQLRVTGGRASPERAGRIIGALLMVIGLVLGIYAYFGLSHPTTNPLQQGDATVVGLLGVGCTVVGTGMFVVGTTSDPQEGFANPVAIAGAVVGIVGPLASMALILQKDSVSFSLAPLAVGALPGRKEGAAAPPTSLPLSRSCPADGTICPLQTPIVVLFPAPLGPRSAYICPAPTDRLTPWRTSIVP